MSMQGAREELGKIPEHSSQRHETGAIVAAAGAVETALHSLHTLLSIVGPDVNRNLQRIDQTNQNVSSTIQSLVSELEDLNHNLRKIDASTTSLGTKANWLGLGLLVFTALLAVPIIVEYWPHVSNFFHHILRK